MALKSKKRRTKNKSNSAARQQARIDRRAGATLFLTTIKLTPPQSLSQSQLIKEEANTNTKIDTNLASSDNTNNNDENIDLADDNITKVKNDDENNNNDAFDMQQGMADRQEQGQQEKGEKNRRFRTTTTTTTTTTNGQD